MEPKEWEPKKDMSVPSLFTQLHKLCLLYHQAFWVYLSTEALSDFCILETPSWPLKTGVIPNQAFTGLPNRRCLQSHTQIEFVYLDSLRLCNPDDKMMIQLTERWHDGTMLVTHLSFAQTPSDPRNIRLINSSSTMELAPPWIWFARAMEPPMRPPLVDKERNLMESLYSPFFFSLGDNPRMSKKCGRCSEISESNETSHLKGVYRQQHSFVAVGHCHWSSSETTNNFVPSREYVPNLTATMLALQAASFVRPRNFVLDLWGGGCNTTLWLSCEVSNFEASFSLVAPAKLQSIKDIAAEQWRRGLAAWIDFWTCF